MTKKRSNKKNNKENKDETGFSSITNYLDLKNNLIAKAKGLHNTSNKTESYLCHYTSIEAAIGIIETGLWYIGSPLNMNDGLELSHHEGSTAWKRMFFASFMTEPKESIAMWSMYAQPWDRGVMIKIPIEKFKNFVNSEPTIYSANIVNKKVVIDSVITNAKTTFHAIAYTNSDSKDENESECLYCGTLRNDLVTDVLQCSDLVGFVKDVAWSYENEYRLRVDVKENVLYKGVSLQLTDDFIKSIKIVLGPRYDKMVELKKIEDLGFGFESNNISRSIFYNKLKKVYCDTCLKLSKKDRTDTLT